MKNNKKQNLFKYIKDTTSQFQVLCKPSLWCRIEIH